MSLRLNQWFRRAAVGVTAIAFLLLAITAGRHVVNGEAAEAFTNVKGVHITWGTAFVFLVGGVVALGAALVARWWHGRGGWLRFARFSCPRIARSDDVASGSPADMPSNKSLERTREG
jgi:hypothetical protein